MLSKNQISWCSCNCGQPSNGSRISNTQAHHFENPIVFVLFAFSPCFSWWQVLLRKNTHQLIYKEGSSSSTKIGFRDVPEEWDNLLAIELYAVRFGLLLQWYYNYSCKRGGEKVKTQSPFPELPQSLHKNFLIYPHMQSLYYGEVTLTLVKYTGSTKPLIK